MTEDHLNWYDLGLFGNALVATCVGLVTLFVYFSKPFLLKRTAVTLVGPCPAHKLLGVSENGSLTPNVLAGLRDIWLSRLLVRRSGREAIADLKLVVHVLPTEALVDIVVTHIPLSSKNSVNIREVAPGERELIIGLLKPAERIEFSILTSSGSAKIEIDERTGHPVKINILGDGDGCRGVAGLTGCDRKTHLVWLTAAILMAITSGVATIYFSRNQFGYKMAEETGYCGRKLYYERVVYDEIKIEKPPTCANLLDSGLVLELLVNQDKADFGVPKKLPMAPKG